MGETGMDPHVSIATILAVVVLLIYLIHARSVGKAIDKGRDPTLEIQSPLLTVRNHYPPQDKSKEGNSDAKEGYAEEIAEKPTGNKPHGNHLGATR
jgi:hypothetical protein